MNKGCFTIIMMALGHILIKKRPNNLFRNSGAYCIGKSQGSNKECKSPKNKIKSFFNFLLYIKILFCLFIYSI